LSFTYDANNRMTNMVDGLGTSSYAYDAVGQLLYEDGPWAYDTVSYSYSNRLRTGLGIAAPDPSAWFQSYAYDAVKRLTNVTSLAGPHGYSYDTTRQAQIAALVYPNGSSVTNCLGKRCPAE
jgi:YD repeat-containing protein